MPKTLYISEGYSNSTGIRVTYTKSRRAVYISGWYDSFVGIDGKEFTLKEFFSALGVTQRDCDSAFKEPSKPLEQVKPYHSAEGPGRRHILYTLREKLKAEGVHSEIGLSKRNRTVLWVYATETLRKPMYHIWYYPKISCFRVLDFPKPGLYTDMHYSDSVVSKIKNALNGVVDAEG
jgi:hypothetical protein